MHFPIIISIPRGVAFRAAMLVNNTGILYAGAARRPGYNVSAA
jgi:hypothetical protein